MIDQLDWSTTKHLLNCLIKDLALLTRYVGVGLIPGMQALHAMGNRLASILEL